MNAAEFEIYKTLKGCNRKVAALLMLKPGLRDIDTEEFVSEFRSHHEDSKYSMETIRRSRQHTQNTLRFCPRDGKVTNWTKPMRELNKDPLDNPLQEELRI